MVQGILPGSRVLELGAGTGTVTRAIVDAGVDPQDLDIVEVNPHFVRMLRMRFPDAAIHEIDALTMARQLPHLHSALDCVVSCLPMLLLSRPQRMRVLAGAFSLLGHGGVLHQFTYGGRCPVDARMLAKLGLSARRIGVATRNFPPAFVYRLARSPDRLR